MANKHITEDEVNLLINAKVSQAQQEIQKFEKIGMFYMINHLKGDIVPPCMPVPIHDGACLVPPQKCDIFLNSIKFNTSIEEEIGRKYYFYYLCSVRQ